jgi:hypothetical protein
MSGVDVKRKVLFLTGGTAVVLLALVAFFAWIVALAAFVPLTWRIVPALAVALVATAAVVWLGIRVWRVRPRQSD